jgi:hypothetical protein
VGLTSGKWPAGPLGRSKGAEARQADHPLAVLPLLGRLLPGRLTRAVIDDFGGFRRNDTRDNQPVAGRVHRYAISSGQLDLKITASVMASWSG